MNTEQPKSTGRVRTRRDVIRRHRRERQIIIFGVLLIALGAAAFAAAGVYSGRTGSPLNQPIMTFEAQQGDDVNIPCPPAVPPLDPSRVVVRVLNGTSIQGLAGNTLNKLTGRGFASGGATNWSRGSYDGGVRISFGDQGVAEAYTVARHFENVELVQDSRDNHSVDVVLGLEFNETTGLRPQFAPELDPNIPLTANSICVPPEIVNEEPAPRTYPQDLPEETPEPTVSVSSRIADDSEFSD